MKSKNYTSVFKLDLAGWLMQRGFLLCHCERHANNPNRIVYYFVSSNELEAAIGEYKYRVRRTSR